MIRLSISLFLFLPLFCFTQNIDYQHPIPFEAKEYVAYKTNQTIKIDGKLNESDWAKAEWTSDFVDIEGNLKPTPAHRTRAKMLWDDKYFYFAAVLEEPHIWATLTERDAIMYHNDDFEIFIDPDADGEYYYEFEMNAHNAIWDLFMLRPYRVDERHKYIMEWDIKGIQSGVHIEGTLNEPSDTDQFWSVEVAMPWEVLRWFAKDGRMPLAGEQWRVNFSRVDWWMDIKDEKYVKKPNAETGEEQKWPQENWVWSPSGRVDMHQTETWGYVQFSDKKVGKGEDIFTPNPEEAIKWALWQLYFQQRKHKEAYGHYSNSTKGFRIPIVEIEGYYLQPKVECTTHLFEISAASLDKDKRWYINHEGRIWKE